MTPPPGAFDGKPQWTYRLYRVFEQRDSHEWLRYALAYLTRERMAFPWEWILFTADQARPTIEFAAPRVVTGLHIRFRPAPDDQTVRVSSWDGTDWQVREFERDPHGIKNGIELRLRFTRLFLTRKLRVELRIPEGTSVEFAPKFMRARYSDVVDLVMAHQYNEAGNVDAAKRHWLQCLKTEPNHYLASERLARQAMDAEEWSDAMRYAMQSSASTRGTYGDELLWEVCAGKRAQLDELVPELRAEAQDWDVSGHVGSICLANEKTYWFGFGRFHLLEARQIVEVRRQAAARMLRHLHFDYTVGKEKIAYVGLRIWRGEGKVIEIPTERIAIVDHEDDNPAIRMEGKKRALYHLPEMHRGDVIELVYYLIHLHPERDSNRPDFFILSDLSCQFPTWKSEATLITPKDWNVRCLCTNGGPEPVHTQIDDGLQSHSVEMETIFYDEWGLSEIERRYRSPHVCASWGDRTWAEVASVGLAKFCHVMRDDTLPAPIQAEIDRVDAVEDKLRVGFDWIRDKLKYMSLQSNKNLTEDPDLANKIVSIGVGDCMDRAYLISVLCRALGIDAEYVVTAAESEYVVPDLPSPQFDHILVRAHLNGRSLYLDATSSETPFGWLPRYLQGLPILPLTPNATLETVDEEGPEANQLAIAERLTCDAAGNVAGTFEMMAFGMPGRWWDGHWKATSMEVEDPIRVARLALRRQMPTADLKDWDIRAYEPGRERFALSGHHSRLPLFPIGDQLVGFLNYRTELFQMYQNKDRDWSGVSIFPLPLRYGISLELTAPDGYTIEGVSDRITFSSDFGDVRTSVTRNGSGLELDCEMTVKRKFVRDQNADDVQAFLKTWERALSFAFVLSKVV